MVLPVASLQFLMALSKSHIALFCSGSGRKSEAEEEQEEQEQDSTPSTPLSNHFTGRSIIVNGGGEPNSKRQKTTNVAHQINIGGGGEEKGGILSTDQQQQLAVRTLWIQMKDLETVRKNFIDLRKTVVRELDKFQTDLLSFEKEWSRTFEENFQEARMKMRALQQLEQAQEQAKAARLQRTSLATSQFVSSSSSKKQ